MKLKAVEIEKVSEQLGASNPLDLKPFIQCKDHSVSRETFALYLDEKRDMLVTIPQPPKDQLPGYYESEDYISHTDSKRNLLEKVYHLVRQFSLKKKEKLITRVNQGEGRVLDVGCGTGDFLKVCEQTGWTIAGVEPNEKARQVALSKTNLKNCYGSIEELIDSNPESFDVITLWHVLEHIPNLADFIAKIKTVLKPRWCFDHCSSQFQKRRCSALWFFLGSL